jgi:hypothetical protein
MPSINPSVGSSSGNFSANFDANRKTTELNIASAKNQALESARDRSDERQIDSAQGQKSAQNQVSSNDRPEDLQRKQDFAALSMSSLPMVNKLPIHPSMGTQNHVA